MELNASRLNAKLILAYNKLINYNKKIKCHNNDIRLED